MKVYAVVCEQQYDEPTELISIHKSFEGARKSMKREAFKLIDDEIAILIEEAEDHINLGYECPTTNDYEEPEIDPWLKYCIVTKDLLE